VGNRAFFAELLGDVLTQSAFLPHEYAEEVVPQVASEYEQVIRSPPSLALDIAHQLAFRKDLGNSLFATPHTEVPYPTAVEYARSAFSSPAGSILLGTGVDAQVLKPLVDDFFNVKSQARSINPTSSSSQYFGGEVRLPPTTEHSVGEGHFLLAFPGGPRGSAQFSVLRHLLGGESSLKWNRGTSPLANIESGEAKAFNVSYPDAGLFGIQIKSSIDRTEETVQKAVTELKKVAKGVDKEELKKAIGKAKYEAASALESRIGRLELVGSQVSHWRHVIRTRVSER
jgi:ubiquinol-cytochrome c reductase core subunit 2